MVCLNAKDLARLADAAGFADHNQRATAVAIALAEGQKCSCNDDDPQTTTCVKSDSVGDGGDSIGPWQINRANWTDEYNEQTLRDPATNARAAHDVWARQGPRAWTMYRNGTYRRYMEEAAVAELVTQNAPHVGLPTPSDFPEVPVVSDVVGFLQNAWGVISAAAGWLGDPHNWVRILYVVGGVALGLGTIVVAVKPYATATARRF